MAQGKQDPLAGRVAEIAEKVGLSENIEIVEVELLGGGKSRLLRITIDKPEGVSHGDCEFISREVGNVLDAEDLIPGDSYHLEVTSPGVERKLKGPKDFERFTGQKAKIVLTEPVENQKHWEGTLRGMEGNAVALEPSEGKLVRIPVEAIRRANLKFEW